MTVMKYRLNLDALAGEFAAKLDGLGSAEVAVPGHGAVALSASLLIEVPPPQPPEPDLHAVVLDGNGRAWQRVGLLDDGWALTGVAVLSDWPQVCCHGAPTLLTLDPFAEPVALPWTTNVGQTFIAVDLDEGGPVVTLEWRGLLPCTINADLSPNLAEEASRALWTAAQRRRAVR